MNKNKYMSIFHISFIIIIITGCIFFITSIIKSFNEWNRPLGSYKQEIKTKYKDNKNTFFDVVAYVQSIDSEVSIERGEGTNYKSYKYGGGIRYYTIDDKSIDKNLRQVFKENFISIDKDRGAVYFVYTNEWGGAQGVIYTDDLKKLVRYNGMEVEEIENHWYYFIGQ